MRGCYCRELFSTFTSVKRTESSARSGCSTVKASATASSSASSAPWAYATSKAASPSAARTAAARSVQ